jgi:hypothetical protein
MTFQLRADSFFRFYAIIKFWQSIEFLLNKERKKVIVAEQH